MIFYDPHIRGTEHSREERQVCDGELATNEPLLLGEYIIQDAKYTLDLVLVALNRAGHLLRVEDGEPGELTEVRALARGLEKQPLELGVLLACVCDGNFVLRVVLVHKVGDDST